MILKGSQRAGGKALAIHLLRLDENDHVEVHQIRGFVGESVEDAFREAYAISRGTKCKQFLFSLSLSPPIGQQVPVSEFEASINKIEMRLALVGQPRVVVFHEKDGRRHAHCVWSRIDAKTMIARPMSHFKRHLTELSREIFLEHGWKMPSGLANHEERDPLNFTLAEWQQAKRVKRDPERIKALFKDCWAISDSGAAFQRALEARGYYLATGDRRGYVATDWQGEIYSISRWCGKSTALVDLRLKDLELRPVAEVSAEIAAKVEAKLHALQGEAAREFEFAQRALKTKRDVLVKEQRAERQRFDASLSQRWTREELERAARLRKGLKGIWDLVTGRRSKVLKQNALEVDYAFLRDARERDAFVAAQVEARRRLQAEIGHVASRHDRHLERSNASVDRMNVPSKQVQARPGIYVKRLPSM
jgi:hypothetical protein